jgi:hypothetical protein
MKAASQKEIKNELASKTHSQILQICTRLIKYKKENKELLSYLLFEAHDERSFIKGIQADIDFQFDEMNKSNVYFIKKSLRKILRMTNKYIRYSGVKETEIELLIYFCRKIKNSGFPVHKSPVLNNLYQRQIQKIKKTILSLHEDLQYDYSKEIELLII